MRRAPEVGASAHIAVLAQRFLCCTLPKEDWNHRTHIAVAAWLSQSEAHDAAQEMPRLIRTFNASVGIPNSETEGYHATITQASLEIIAQTLSAADVSEPLFSVINRLLKSRIGDPSWLLAHWSSEYLFSPQARAAWVPPDLAPLSSFGI